MARTQVGTQAAGGTPDRLSRRGIMASIAAMIAAFLASLCCIGPVLFVTLGIGAGLAARFEPVRPALTVVALVFIAIAAYVVYGARSSDVKSCEGSDKCVVPRNSSRHRLILWIAIFVTLGLLTFPRWSGLVL